MAAFDNLTEHNVHGISVDMAWLPECATKYVMRKAENPEEILSALGLEKIQSRPTTTQEEPK